MCVYVCDDRLSSPSLKRVKSHTFKHNSMMGGGKERERRGRAEERENKDNLPTCSIVEQCGRCGQDKFNSARGFSPFTGH